MNNKDFNELYKELEKKVKDDGDKLSRNDPCPCGSGKKYKKCCKGKDNQ